MATGTQASIICNPSRAAMLTSIGAMKHGKKKKFSGERELRTGKRPQGAASRARCGPAAQNHSASAGRESCRKSETTGLWPASNGRAALPDYPVSWHEQRRPAERRTPPPQKGIAEQPLAASRGEIRNMHIGARYAAAVDAGVSQPCYRPKAIAASNTDCKLPLASPHPPSVAAAEPSARLPTQQKI